MGVPTSEVGYTPAMSRREDHQVHKGHVVALGGQYTVLVLSLHVHFVVRFISTVSNGEFCLNLTL